MFDAKFMMNETMSWDDDTTTQKRERLSAR